MSQRLCGEQLKTPAFSSDLSRVSNKLMLLNSDQKTPGLDISTMYLRLQAYAEKSPKKRHGQYRSKGTTAGQLDLQIDCSDFLVNLCVVLLPNWLTGPAPES